MKRIPFWQFLIFPFLLKVFGAAMNVIVMARNGNQMPVFMPGGCDPRQMALEDSVHVCMTPLTHWKFMADWIHINGLGIASIGDLFIWSSDYLSLYCVIVWAVLVIQELNY